MKPLCIHDTTPGQPQLILNLERGETVRMVQASVSIELLCRGWYGSITSSRGVVRVLVLDPVRPSRADLAVFFRSMADGVAKTVEEDESFQARANFRAFEDSLLADRDRDGWGHHRGRYNR
jgi:hypothetical protein